MLAFIIILLLVTAMGSPDPRSPAVHNCHMSSSTTTPWCVFTRAHGIMSTFTPHTLRRESTMLRSKCHFESERQNVNKICFFDLPRELLPYPGGQL